MRPTERDKVETRQRLMLEETMQQKQESPRPELPELYQILSKLIENPKEFFDSMIQVETKDNNLTVRAWHIPNPVISLRDIPNSISQAGTDRFPATPEENQPVYPMELHLTPIKPKTIGPEEVKIEEILDEQFETALIHRTKEILSHHLSQQWEEPEHIMDLLTAAKCVFYASDISESLEVYIDNLDWHLQQEIEKKLNPQVINLLGRSAPSSGFKPSREETSEETPQDKILYTMDPNMGEIRTTIDQYNKATLILGCSKKTRSANAGAVPFILAQETSHQEVSDQGQFIGNERAQAMQHGMTTYGWKRMTHMDPKLIHSIVLLSKDLEEAAGIINWLAHQGEKIEESNLSQIMQYDIVREKLSRPPKNLEDLNMVKIAALTIKHKETHVQSAPQEQDTRHQIVDAVAYAHRMTLDGTKITATTWGGILKAIHRWHQRMNREETRQQWTDIVNNNGGKIRWWKPTLGQFKHQDVTATELTNECMLLQEALEMSHCVHLYGSRAKQGTVRIFSLTQESGNRATASVVLRDGLWRQEQISGQSNHPTTDAMRECTLALAEACNQE